MNTFIADPVTEENKQSNFRWLMDNGYRGYETDMLRNIMDVAM